MASNRPAVSFTQSLGTEILNIYVGTQRKWFCVHGQLLWDKATSLWTQVGFDGLDELFPGRDCQGGFSMLVEWLYRDKIEPPSQHRTDDDVRAAVEACVYLDYFACTYNIKGLSDAALEHLGVCYLLKNILPSQAEMRLVFDICDASSPIGRYMVHMFFELLIRYPEHNPTTLRETADMSTLDMWPLLRNMRTSASMSSKPSEQANLKLLIPGVDKSASTTSIA